MLMRNSILSFAEWWWQVVPDLSWGHEEECRGGSGAALHAPLPQRGKTSFINQTPCMSPPHCPDRKLAEEILPAHSNPSMSYITSTVHGGSSFLDMHEVKWIESTLWRHGALKQFPPGLRTDAYWSAVSVWWVLKAARRLEQSRPRSGSEAAACQVRRLSDERRKSADGPISTLKEPHTLRRQLSLRRHRWYHSVEGGDSSRRNGGFEPNIWSLSWTATSVEISGPWLFLRLDKVAPLTATFRRIHKSFVQNFDSLIKKKKRTFWVSGEINFFLEITEL